MSVSLACVIFLAPQWLAVSAGQQATRFPATQGAARAGSPVSRTPVSRTPVSWKLTESPRNPLRMGQEFGVVAQATVKAGWHLYALDEPEDGPAPLEFSVPPGGPAALVSVGADRPERGPGALAGSPVDFYMGQPRFRLRLRVGANSRPGREPVEVVVAVEIRFQACNDRMCLPPRLATLEFPATVGPP